MTKGKSPNYRRKPKQPVRLYRIHGRTKELSGSLWIWSCWQSGTKLKNNQSRLLHRTGKDRRTQNPIINVFNKSDLTSKPIPFVEDNNVFISAKEKIGITELIQIITQKIFPKTIECKLLIPYERGNIVSYFNENTFVKSVNYENNGTLMVVECNEQDYNRYKEFICL